MTKDKFLFELIDQCMFLACMDNIMIENFELRDDKEFYKQIENQFFSCIKFYKEMDDLYRKGCISEQEMDEELSDVLVLIRQKEIKQLVEDFDIYLYKTDLTDVMKGDERQKLKNELLSETIDTEFILKKIRDCRELEQQDTV
ncbi:MAG: hypothetical protein K2J99_15510 [Lachnospiraceae bacterium]|nr:hypothetical protein [Lachnospiraceae bacterium]